MFRPSRRVAAHRSAASHSPQSLDQSHTFTRRAHETVSSALRGESHLAKYARAFADAQLDEASLAELMGIAEIQRVVPDAPLSDVLKLKRLFSTCFEPVADLPATPFWFYAAPCVSKMALHSETIVEIVSMWEIAMLVSALLLSLSAGLLFDVQQGCTERSYHYDDPERCEWLLTVDYVLQGACVAVMMLSILAAFACYLVYNAVHPHERPAWCRRFWGFVMLPTMACIVGCLTFGVSLSIRVTSWRRARLPRGR